ncbi:MAG: hypothetical protein FWG69_03665 [Oscillospiraceae bacterium]|nr:hypothetical protein [Oscillospiraceae bacterium]
MTRKEHSGVLRFATLILGAIAVVSSAAYFACKIYNNKKYDEKWKDYNDCGLA